MKEKRMSYDFIKKLKRDVVKNPGAKLKKIKKTVARMQATKGGKT